MAKPFSIQAPEEIAKQYAGNKQQIAAAMQMGVVDPTAGVLAGMFIDRMRAAQMQEQAPQATVAQQVMGGAPPAQPAAPAPAPASPSPGGLGATPQAAPPMAPPIPQMPQGPGMAAGGMVPPYASGGLSDVPVPDTMFDEPSNGGFDDGYGGGGLVAFADGGPTGYMSDNEYIHYILSKESGGRNYDEQGRPITSKRGALYAMQVLPSTARQPGYGVTPARNDSPEEYNRVGRELALALRKRFGTIGGAAAYNMGPGAYKDYMANKIKMPEETSKYIAGLGSRGRAAAPAAGGLGATINPDLPAPPTTPSMSLETAIGQATPLYDKLVPAPKREARDMLLQYAKQLGDPEEIKKQANQDKWMTLAQIGFNMAASNSPYLLQAVGAAAAAALPGAREAKKEREARKRDALRMYADIEGLDNQDAKDRVNGILGLAKTHLDMSKDEIARQFEVWKTQYTQGEETRRTAMQVQGNKDVAGIYAIAGGAKSERDPYDSKTETLKTPEGDISVNTRVNKQTGSVEYYSNELGKFLAPEYADAVRGKAGIADALKTWQKQNPGVQVGVVDGRIMWHNPADGKSGVFRPAWLAAQ